MRRKIWLSALLAAIMAALGVVARQPDAPLPVDLLPVEPATLGGQELLV